jgi:hypothetical protein
MFGFGSSKPKVDIKEQIHEWQSQVLFNSVEEKPNSVIEAAGGPPDWKRDRAKPTISVWCLQLKAEQRGLDRQVREVQRSEEKLKREIVAVAKKDPVSARMLAKNIVQCRRTTERLITCRAQIGSVAQQLATDAGTWSHRWLIWTSVSKTFFHGPLVHCACS